MRAPASMASLPRNIRLKLYCGCILFGFVALAFAVGRMASAQTEEQAVEYVRSNLTQLAKVSETSRNIKVGSDFLVNCEEAYADSGKPVTLVRAQWDDVTGISVYPMHDKGCELVIKGRFVLVFVTPDGEEDGEIVQTTSCVLKNDPDAIRRLVKAIKHLCQLKGAKLVEEELF